MSTREAWPFLIGRTRDHGHRVVVVPGFMTEPDDIAALRDATGHGAGMPDDAAVRELTGLSSGPVTAVFRSYLPRASQFGLGGEEVLTDEHGRPIRLTEGFVVRGAEVGAKKAGLTVADLDRAHDAVTGAYRQYWTGGRSFTRSESVPFTTAASAAPPGTTDSEIPRPVHDVPVPPIQVDQPAGQVPSPPARHRARKLAVALVVVVLAVIATVLAEAAFSRGGPAPQMTPAQLLYSVCADLRTGDLSAIYGQTTAGYQQKNDIAAFRTDLLPGAAAKAGTCTYTVKAVGKSSAQAILAISGAAIPGASWQVTVTLQQDQPWRISAIAPGPGSHR